MMSTTSSTSSMILCFLGSDGRPSVKIDFSGSGGGGGASSTSAPSPTTTSSFEALLRVFSDNANAVLGPRMIQVHADPVYAPRLDDSAYTLRRKLTLGVLLNRQNTTVRLPGSGAVSSLEDWLQQQRRQRDEGSVPEETLLDLVNPLDSSSNDNAPSTPSSGSSSATAKKSSSSSSSSARPVEDDRATTLSRNIYLFGAVPFRAAVDWLKIYQDLEREHKTMTASTWLAVLGNWYHLDPATGAATALKELAVGRAPHLFVTHDQKLHYETIRDQLRLPTTDLWRWTPLGMRRGPRVAALRKRSDLTVLTPVNGGVHAWATPEGPAPSALQMNMPKGAELLDSSSYLWSTDAALAVFHAAAPPPSSSQQQPVVVFGFTRATLERYLSGRCSDAQFLQLNFFGLNNEAIFAFSGTDVLRLEAEKRLADAAASSSASSSASSTPKPPPLSNHGVNRFHAILHPSRQPLRLPMQPIFNVVHATRRVPMIVFADGAKNSNLPKRRTVRLYTAGNVALNGRPVPSLPMEILQSIRAETEKPRKRAGPFVFFCVRMQENPDKWTSSSTSTTTATSSGDDENADEDEAAGNNDDYDYDDDYEEEAEAAPTTSTTTTNKKKKWFKTKKVVPPRPTDDEEGGGEETGGEESGGGEEMLTRMFFVFLYHTGHMEIKSQGDGAMRTPVPHTMLDAWLQHHMRPVFEMLTLVLKGVLPVRYDLRADDENMEMLNMSWCATANNLILKDPVFMYSAAPFLAPTSFDKAWPIRYTRVEYYEALTQLREKIYSLAAGSGSKSVRFMLLKNLQKTVPEVSLETLNQFLVEFMETCRPVVTTRGDEPISATLRVHRGLLVSFSRFSEISTIGTITVEDIREPAYLQFLASYLDAALRLREQLVASGMPLPAAAAAAAAASSSSSSARTAAASSALLPVLPVFQSPTVIMSPVLAAANRDVLALLSSVNNNSSSSSSSSFLPGNGDDNVDDQMMLEGNEEEFVLPDYGDDDDDDEEEEEEDWGGGEDVGGGGGVHGDVHGGAKAKATRKRRRGGEDGADAEKTSGANDGYTLARMKEHFDPNLNTRDAWYARTCSKDRQPMVLAQHELDKVERDFASDLNKPFESVIQFGTSKKFPGEALYWACPKYWCTKPGSEGPLTAAQANDPSVCGNKIGPGNPQSKDTNTWVTNKEGFEDWGGTIGVTTVSNQKDRNGREFNVSAPCCFVKKGSSKGRDNITKNRNGVAAEDDDDDDDDDDDAAAATRRKTPSNALQSLQSRERIPPRNIGRVNVRLRELLRTPVEMNSSGKNGVAVDNTILVRYGVAVRPEQEVGDDYGMSSTAAAPPLTASSSSSSNHPPLSGRRLPDQSFLGCLANALFAANPKYRQSGTVPTIAFVRNVLAGAVHLDLFVRLNNATLIQLFGADDAAASDAAETKKKENNNNKALFRPPLTQEETAAYTGSLFFRSLKISKKKHANPVHLAFFVRAVNAHRAFLAFLRDDRQVLDATYLWELLALPHERLFPMGVNLVMFENTADDDSSNFQFICPQQSYVARPFDPSKPAMLVLRSSKPDKSTSAVAESKVWYQPLYLLTVKESDRGIGKDSIYRRVFKADSLDKHERALHKRLVELLRNAPCNPAFGEMQNATNVPAETVRSTLATVDPKTLLSELVTQVINFQGKCVGLQYLVLLPGAADAVWVVVPTFPSAPLLALPRGAKEAAGEGEAGKGNEEEGGVVKRRYLDNVRLYDRTKFADAVIVLEYIHAVTQLPCKPVARIVSDGLVIGIATQTHQIVRTRMETHSAADAARDGLAVRFTSDPDEADRDATAAPLFGAAAAAAAGNNNNNNNNDVVIDDVHARLVQSIRLDGEMYDAFQQTARATLNEYDHRAARSALQRMATEQKGEALSARRARMVHALRELLPDTRVQFVEGGVLAGATSSPAEARRRLVDAATREWLHTEQGALLLPARLFAHPEKRTASVFFLKLADQMLRDHWRRKFLFHPEVAYLFGADRLDQRADETVMPQSMMTDEYAKTLQVATDRRQKRRTVYDFHRSVDQMPPVAIPQL